MRLAAIIFAAGLCLILPGNLKANEVRALQQILSDRNCEPGPIDGLWGGMTAAALERMNAQADLQISRPISDSDIAALEASEARCVTWADMAVHVFDASAMAENVTRNGDDYCRLGNWDSFLGPAQDAVVHQSLRIEGEDLAFYLANAEPYMNRLLRLNVMALRDSDYDALRTRFMDVIDNDGFTRLERYRPTMWHGERVDWIGWYARNMSMAEPAYYAALLMTVMAQSYGILRDHLSEEERAAARAWGERIHRASDLREVRSERWADRRAAKAAGYTMWGAAVGDRRIFDRGVALFREGVHNIRADGSESDFVGPSAHRGTELRYQHMTYALLSMAAWAMEKTGEPAFDYARRGRGSLIDGINFHLEQSFDPESRRRMQRDQIDTFWVERARNLTDLSLAFSEFLVDAGLTTDQIPLLDDALTRRRFGSPQGFFGSHHGGYASCLFAQQETAARD